MPSSHCHSITPDPYTVACDRIVNQTIELAEARGIQASVDVHPERDAYNGVPARHQIKIAYEHYRRVLAVDHDTFMSEDLFKTLVLHKIAAALEDLIPEDIRALS